MSLKIIFSLIFLLPLFSGILLCIFKKLSFRYVYLFTIFINALIIVFALFLFINYSSFINDVRTVPINFDYYRWFSIGDFSIDFSLVIDSFSTLMMVFVLTISLLVQIYACAYLPYIIKSVDEHRHFIALINFFIFAMLLVVCANDLIVLFFGWEVISLCSYLLISQNYRSQIKTQVGSLAFIVGRIGDLFMLIGFSLLIITSGESNLHNVFSEITKNNFLYYFWGSEFSASSIALSFILGGVISKSAQLPLHFWLPSAMVATIPVSALIHSATLVSAGIILLVRLTPMFAESIIHLQFLLYLGLCTYLLFAIVASTCLDIKVLLAYSTISHLGIIIVLFALRQFDFTIVELIIHGFYKALLFMCAGLIILIGSEQNLYRLSNIYGSNKIVFLLMLLAIYLMLPLPFGWGSYIKNVQSSALNLSNNNLIELTIYLAEFFTAVYLGKLIFLIFAAYKKSPQHTENMTNKKLQVNCIIYIPMFVLAAGLLFISIITNILPFFEKDYLSITANSLSLWLTIIGLTIAWLIYYQYPHALDKTLQTQPIKLIYQIFAQELFVEKLINKLISSILFFANELLELFEKFIFSGITQRLTKIINLLSYGTIKIESTSNAQIIANVIFASTIFLLLLLIIS